jgi:hypothetical protein
LPVSPLFSVETAVVTNFESVYLNIHTISFCSNWAVRLQVFYGQVTIGKTVCRGERLRKIGDLRTVPNLLERLFSVGLGCPSFQKHAENNTKKKLAVGLSNWVSTLLHLC